MAPDGWIDELRSEDLESVVAGDVEKLPVLERHTQDELRYLWQHSKQPPVTRQAVLRVLMRLHRGEITQRQVASWAQFLFYGSTSTAQLPYKPLDIEYDPLHEDLVATAIMRLEQTDDDRPGPLSTEELDSMIQDLSSH